MFAIKHRIFLTLALVLAVTCTAGAQAQRPNASASPTPDDFVTEKGFRSRVFEIRQRDPGSLLKVLIPLGSGLKGAMMTYNTDFKTITVRDFPENIAVIEEAIKRLDVAEPPQPARPNIEFHVHLLIASNSAAAPAQLPSELTDVVRQLQSTLNYKSYTLMSSQVVRYGGRLAQVSNKGVSELKLSADTPASKNPIFYDYELVNINLEETANSSPKVQVGAFNFTMKIPIMVGGSGQTLQYEHIGFRTPVTLADGEKVVVGTTSMEDKGVIIVLTARLEKK